MLPVACVCMSVCLLRGCIVAILMPLENCNGPAAGTLWGVPEDDEIMRSVGG